MLETDGRQAVPRQAVPRRARSQQQGSDAGGLTAWLRLRREGTAFIGTGGSSGQGASSVCGLPRRRRTGRRQPEVPRMA